MEQKTENLKSMLAYGSVSLIARNLKVSPAAVSKALKKGSPGSAIVREALRMAQESGAIEAAKTLASLAA